MIVYKDIEQRSPEWCKIRRGILTASNYKYVITPAGEIAKSKISKKFMRDLVIECFVEDDPHKDDAARKLERNFAINWGNDHESTAREWFDDNIMQVSEVAFVEMHKGLPVGCSPDGLIPHNENLGEWIAGLEIKCPAFSTHVEYLDAKKLPDEYKLQVHGSLAVTGLDHWYFLSYYPGFIPFLIKVERDEFTEKVKQSLIDFCDVYEMEFDRLSKIIKKGEEAA